ncbi:MAG: four-carbon acid sugar kinase family protein [Oscillospiraceae bacterium]|nr:four-carbon acid sugar kinase family protein [Oscillospiraceae bacterium]
MLYIGCIADDFTGAGDAASFLRKGGLKTVYVSGERLRDYSPADDVEAIVIALKCRSIPAAEAVQQITEACRWLLARGAQHIYYKYCSTFDSTPAGNIGPVTDALMKLCGTAYTVLCPALPVNGRTVQDGVLYVSGVPLAESPMRFHPLNPMTESEIPKLMAAQSRWPSYALRLAELYGPEAALKETLSARCAESEGFTLAVDYCEDRDGARIAALFDSLPLLTGGSGLLEHLGHVYKPQTAAEDREDAPLIRDGARLLLAGSCSEMTRKQIGRYMEAGGIAIKVEPLQLLDGQQTVEGLCARIDRAGEDLLFYSSDTAEQVAANQKLGAERISALLENTMGQLAAYAARQGYTRIVVAGGETSGRVMQALEYDVFEILEDAAPGVPRMVPVEKRSLSLVLKSGNFGTSAFS